MNKTINNLMPYFLDNLVEGVWLQPEITSNGTPLVSDFAVFADSEYSTYYAYKATTSGWCCADGFTTEGSCYFGWVSKKKTKLLAFSFNFAKVDSSVFWTHNLKIYGSNDFANWEYITTHNVASYPATATQNVNVNSDKFYYYYKLVPTDAIKASSTSAAAIAIANLKIIAVKKIKKPTNVVEVPISNGYYQNNNNYTADKAFDNNTTTGWYGTALNTAMLNVDYIGKSGLTKKYSKLKIWQGFRSAYPTIKYTCSSFKIQYSINGTYWIDLQTVSTPDDYWNTWQEVNLEDYEKPSYEYYMRLLVTGWSHGNGIWIVNELEFIE